MGGVHRGSRQPLGQAPAGQEKVRFGALAQPVEKDTTPDHKGQEEDDPKPVQEDELYQGYLLNLLPSPPSPRFLRDRLAREGGLGVAYGEPHPDRSVGKGVG